MDFYLNAAEERTPQLLIVDDEQLNRELLESQAECLGYVCQTAASGEEALQKLSPDIDLVLMDVMMPGKDGYETVRQIRSDLRITICRLSW